MLLFLAAWKWSDETDVPPMMAVNEIKLDISRQSIYSLSCPCLHTRRVLCPSKLLGIISNKESNVT
jgi:hypothetical protein